MSTDSFGASGLTVKSLNDIITSLTAGMQGIYGADINVDQNSQDGQMINIFAQACEDIRELIIQVNNSFNPDRAVGISLDERVAINNIQRGGGTFTIQPINITTDRTITLQGLDADFNDTNGTGYAVQDNAGNKFILVDTTVLTAGTYSLNFRAAEIGRVETTVDTITNPVTIVLGVTVINNPSGVLQTGQDEETDTELRLRRQNSVSNASTGYLNGLLGTILNLDGVTDAKIYENITGVTDINGIPDHGVWVIVEGGANTDIADAIYEKKSYGANMKGAVATNIITASGATFTALFDRPVAENLYIRFDIQPTVTGAGFDDAAIKQYIVDSLSYDIGQYADTSRITALAVEAINANGGQGIPINAEISRNGSAWFDYLIPTALNNQFVVDVSRIAITDL